MALRPRILVQKKKTSIKIVHFIGEPKHNVRKPSWDPFIPISTYSKLIVPLCEAKAQEGRIGLYDMVKKDSAKFKQLICERLPFGKVVLSLTNWDQLQIKEQSE